MWVHQPASSRGAVRITKQHVCREITSGPTSAMLCLYTKHFFLKFTGGTPSIQCGSNTERRACALCERGGRNAVVILRDMHVPCVKGEGHEYGVVHHAVHSAHSTTAHC